MELDPRIARLKEVLQHRPVASATREPRTREAAVALLVRPHDELEILLIKRAEHEADPWSGHMALPGGRREPADPDLFTTAIREAEEEVGIAARDTLRLGALDEVTPRTPRLPPIVIAPYVLAVPPHTAAVPHEAEVDAAVWVPLPSLADEAAAHELIVELEGLRRSFPAFRYQEYVIWGLTHRILTQFMELTAEAGV